ncbi:AraC family transcriptional regulator [Amycolatopsis alkalitolerans]|uniref:AraC family transcriptional regulator n=1 Tax=Amycolatopsis alkalitolerans TaxID=2547244 RepID=A0A5C4LYR3_9PSEU|nr:AraC family transcriptional regulator [Amycolatopsis alkalitolerans]TNC22253.1 AraC family transcriptional regulator [Amycolatopsis alkalitolerans]
MTEHRADKAPNEFDLAAIDRTIAEMDPAQYAAEVAAVDAIAVAYAADRLGAEYLDQGDLATARHWYSLAAEHDPCGAGIGLAEVECALEQQAQTAETTEACPVRVESPLRHCEPLRSSDVDEIHDRVSRFLCPHSLEIVKRENKLNAQLNPKRLHNISLLYVSYGCEVSVSPGEVRDFFTIQIPLSGNISVTQGASTFDGTIGRAAVTSPSEPINMRLSPNSRILMCRLDRTALEAQLNELLNTRLSEPLRFDLGMDLTHEMGNSWCDMLMGLTRFVDEPRRTTIPPQFIAGMEQSLMTGLFIAQPSNYSNLLRETLSTELSPPARRALDLIASHPEAPHTAQSLARDVGVSVRSLQQAFRRQMGCSPTEYLRKVRLQRAHDELRARSPELISVNDVAKRWGFRAPRYFSAVYRDRFGESPSETLKRDAPEVAPLP